MILLPSFLIDELEDRVREERFRGEPVGRKADRVEMDHPGVAQKAERTVNRSREMGELLRSRRFEIRTPIAPAGEKRAILVEDHPFGNQGAPVEEVGKASVLAAVVAKEHGSSRYQRGGQGRQRKSGAFGWARAR